MILAMVEGLQRKPVMDPELCRQSRPNKDHLFNEAMRRFQHMELAKHESPQKARWPRVKLENWLKQHPITDPECIAVLWNELENHFGASRAPINNDPPNNDAFLAELQMVNTNNLDSDQSTQNEVDHAEKRSVTTEILRGGKHVKSSQSPRKDNEGNKLKRILDVDEEPRRKPPLDPLRHFKKSEPNTNRMYREAMLQYREMKLQKQEDSRTNNWSKHDSEAWLYQEGITDPECIVFLWNELATQFDDDRAPFEDDTEFLPVEARDTASTAENVFWINHRTDDPKGHSVPTREDQEPEGLLCLKVQEQPWGQQDDRIVTQSVQGNSSDSLSISSLSYALPSLSNASERLPQLTPSSDKPADVRKTQEDQY